MPVAVVTDTTHYLPPALLRAHDVREVSLYVEWPGTTELRREADVEAGAFYEEVRTAAALQALDARFAAVDILPDPRIRQELSALSNWPTIPQLFVKGELVGGADIVTEMYESGELAELLDAEQPEAAEEVAAQSEAPVGNGRIPLENNLE